MEERRYLELGYEEIGTLSGVVKYLGKITDDGDLSYVSVVGGRAVGNPVTVGRDELDMFQRFMSSRG